jgi:hypothetical protein
MTTATNPIFWLLTLAATVILFRYARHPRDRGSQDNRRLGAILGGWMDRGFLKWSLVAVSLAVAGSRVHLAYGVPGDLCQDIVAAEALLSGEQTLYPDNMPERIQRWFHNDPPRLPFPALLKNQKELLTHSQGLYVVQAHPPLAPMLLTPLVALFGKNGASLAFSALSAAAAFFAVRTTFLLLEIRHSQLTPAVATAVLLSWQPSLATFRHGQVSWLLLACLVGCYQAHRRGAHSLAGLGLAAAIHLKAFPALLLLYFLRYDRRSLLFSAAWGVGLAAGLIALTGDLHLFLRYRDAAATVVERYGQSASNLSLGARFQDLALGPATKLIGLGLAAVGLLWPVLRWSAGPVSPAEEARERVTVYCLFIVTALLLSPVCWSSYFPCLLLALALAWQNETILAGREVRSLWLIAIALSLSLPDPLFFAARQALTPLVEARLANFLGSFPTWGILALGGYLIYQRNRLRGQKESPAL